MRVYAENENGAAELEVEQRPMPDERFRELCRLAYALIGAATFIAALYLVGKIALLALIPVFFYALIREAF